ncbi:unnamed protein product [Candidula unifasciata]|uniref:Uncharacterized protein n=1 Tax=Candidula unifasciata TaxID=100452 RepID=A0A8S3ZYQ5_9EUPU|nr:unnamed protein product [Candidula unifasciata]
MSLKPSVISLDHNGNCIDANSDECKDCEKFFKNGKDFSLTSEVSDSLVTQASNSGFTLQGPSGSFTINESNDVLTAQGSVWGSLSTKDATEASGGFHNHLQLQGKRTHEDSHFEFNAESLFLTPATPDFNLLQSAISCPKNYSTDTSDFEHGASFTFANPGFVNSDLLMYDVLVNDTTRVCDRLGNRITSYRSVLSQEQEWAANQELRCKNCGNPCENIHLGSLCEYFFSDFTSLPDKKCCTCQTNYMSLDDDHLCSSMWNWTYSSADKFNVENLQPGNYNISALVDGEMSPLTSSRSSSLNVPLSSKSSLHSSLLPSFPHHDKKQQTLPVVSLFNHSVNFWIMEID